MEKVVDPTEAEQPRFELDAENDDLSDIPSEEEIKNRLEDLREE